MLSQRNNTCILPSFFQSFSKHLRSLLYASTLSPKDTAANKTYNFIQRKQIQKKNKITKPNNYKIQMEQVMK